MRILAGQPLREMLRFMQLVEGYDDPSQCLIMATLFADVMRTESCTCGDADCAGRACGLGRSGQRAALLFPLGLPGQPEGSVAVLGRPGRLHRLALHVSTVFAPQNHNPSYESAKSPTWVVPNVVQARPWQLQERRLKTAWQQQRICSWQTPPRRCSYTPHRTRIAAVK